MVQVKVCGLRDRESARAAVEAGADYVGFVFAPTRRHVAPERARDIIRELPESVGKVGLFVNADAATVREVAALCSLDHVQLCGDEDPEFCRGLGLSVIKSLRVRGPEIEAEIVGYVGLATWCVLDGFQAQAYGGTGTTFDWLLARALTARSRIMVAGGLDPRNVAEAIRVAQPWGVDVSSGVETDGQKDPDKIFRFVRAAKSKADPGRQGRSHESH